MISTWILDLKCVKATFIKGKLTTWQHFQLDINTTIKDLEPGEAYKYSGMDEEDDIQHSNERKNKKRMPKTNKIHNEN